MCHHKSTPDGGKPSFQVDEGLYPDAPTPTQLCNLEMQVDFLVRLCAAWDFGRLPSSDTVREVRRPKWREAVDACRLLTSPAYHLLRDWHNLPRLSYLGRTLAYIRDDPNLMYV